MPYRRLTQMLILAGVLTAPVAAHALEVTRPAEPPVSSSPDSSRTEKKEDKGGTTGRHFRKGWYGWQILIADGAAVGLLLASDIDASGDDRQVDAAAIGAIGIYGVASPTIHFAHGEVLNGLASLLVRGAGLGLTTALVLGSSNGKADGGHSPGELSDFAPLFAPLPILGAIALDIGLLARERPAVENPVERPKRPTTEPVLPTVVGASVVPVPGGGAMHLSGTF